MTHRDGTASGGGEKMKDREMQTAERWPGYAEQSWAERFAELDRQHAALGWQFTGLAQMHASVIPMLGPKGREVVKLWNDKGIVGLHFSWGPEGVKTNGEERAQLHIDIEKACETAEMIEDVDEHLARAPAPTGGTGG